MPHPAPGKRTPTRRNGAKPKPAKPKLATRSNAAAPRERAAPRSAKTPPARAQAEPRRALRVAEVTRHSWPDFERLFLARGSPHYCWCGAYRFRDNPEIGADEKRARMRDLVASGTPIGVLAYDGDDAVAWCSVAPRESYVRLARSRTMPRVSNAPTWTVLCFFVQRGYRSAGVPELLLRGALDVARRHGAEVIEGYPYDTAKISSTHRGTSRVFRAAGFRRRGTRWSLELASPAPA